MLCAVLLPNKCVWEVRQYAQCSSNDMPKFFSISCSEKGFYVNYNKAKYKTERRVV